jgi:hypothetical protein
MLESMVLDYALVCRVYEGCLREFRSVFLPKEINHVELRSCFRRTWLLQKLLEVEAKQQHSCCPALLTRQHIFTCLEAFVGSVLIHSFFARCDDPTKYLSNSSRQGPSADYYTTAMPVAPVKSLSAPSAVIVALLCLAALLQTATAGRCAELMPFMAPASLQYPRVCQAEHGWKAIPALWAPVEVVINCSSSSVSNRSCH